jgi:hypothetical protein
MTAAFEVLEGRCFDGHGKLKAFVWIGGRGGVAD